MRCHVLRPFSLVTTMALATSGAAAAGGDFDGDGFHDLVVGVPMEDIGATDAGAVHVIYGSADGLDAGGDQLWHQDGAGVPGAPESGDRFGSAVAWGDFDGDGFDDLAIGIRNEDVEGAGNAGAVYVLYGSPSGLTSSGDQFWHQNSGGILDTAEASDHFGETLAAGDFNGDGFSDLAIGVPHENIGEFDDAGAVNVLYGSASGLSASGNQFWHQDSTGILEVADDSDQFGDALAAGDFDGDGRDDLAIGVEDENVGTIADAGAVHVLYGSGVGLVTGGDQLWTQDSEEINDAAEPGDDLGGALAAGDFDGDGFDDLAISVDREDDGAVTDAGIVLVLYGTPEGLDAAGHQFWHQNIIGIEDSVELSDRFGADLATGDFDGDGLGDLAIGVEGEDVGAVAQGGAVTVLYGSASGLAAFGDQFVTQDTPGVSNNAEAGDMFGGAVVTGDYDGNGRDDLAIGVAGENIGGGSDAGAVHVIYGSGSGLSASGEQLWHQNSSGIANSAETGDGFGSVL